jgi:regulator of sirC expression with transglutaminase-like and TPR domain
MSALQQFEKDEQFMRLVRRESDVDLVVAALEIARDGQPELDFEPTLQTIRTAIAELTRPVALAGSDRRELGLLIQYLSDELNLHGHHESFDSSACSYLNRVIETGRGIPITLSIVYMAVANELGIPLTGVAAPAHFLTQLQTDGGVLYIDPFRRGHIMDGTECVKWLHELTELPNAELWPTLKPTSERKIIIRLLNNLKSLFGGRGQWRSAWKVQKRLALLSPSSYREKRDLAMLSLRAGRPGEAISQLESCIAVCSPEERPVLQQQLKEAHRETPLYN